MFIRPMPSLGSLVQSCWAGKDLHACVTALPKLELAAGSVAECPIIAPLDSNSDLLCMDYTII